MRSLYKPAAICLLCCALLLSLTCCGSTPPTQAASPAATQLPSESQMPTPTPGQTGQSEMTFASGSPSVSPDEKPLSTDDIPAMIPDAEATLTYTVGEGELTVPAVLHHTPYGYSIVYDTEHYVCNTFTAGESYWAGEGNYLAVSLLSGLPMDDVIAGLRLQENIAMDPELTAVGAGEYISYTLYFTTTTGLYRQFWIIDCGSSILLVEQSYDTVSDNAPLYRAGQLAMLETLTLLS